MITKAQKSLQAMIAINDLKKTFYCYICDATTQYALDHKNMVISYTQGFCTSIIANYREMIHFVHIEFIRYASSLLQYTECYETNANAYNIPFTNFLKKYLRRIPFIRNCLRTAVRKPEDAAKECWFICNKYSLQKVSEFFEGEFKLLSRIKLAVTSFIRKFEQGDRFTGVKNVGPVDVSGKPLDLSSIENVDGLLIEPVAPGLLITNKKFVLNDTDRPFILGRSSDVRYNGIDLQHLVDVNKFLRGIGLPELSIQHEVSKNVRYQQRYYHNLNKTFYDDVLA